MGHAGYDAKLVGEGVAGAAPGHGGAPRRPVQAVRRGAVRAGRSQVGPSSWEHVEVTFGDDLEQERVCSLRLADGGQFHAAIFERLRPAGSAELQEPAIPQGTPSAESSGSWRPYRGGVELVFEAEEDLNLEEVVIVYCMRHNCLVADEAALPDGLAQEYSPCRSLAAPSLQRPAAPALAVEDLSRGLQVDDQQGPMPASPAASVASEPGHVVGLIEEGDCGSSDSELEVPMQGRPAFPLKAGAAEAEDDEDYPDDFEREEASDSESRADDTENER
eukprot:TRINITY_DN31294_c0_g1_i1.p1 TRINITY_DN31294_c0_g1~~TRINITY_DN31294_c0_g1_i1.p1  ORF type:complete len:291 (+),score=54.70 TRINITY_DN31294_c0_g1_i1:47-874(+)